MLNFYGATRAAETLTLSRLDHFIDAYDQTSAFNNHGNGPPKSRFEVVTNLAEVRQSVSPSVHQSASPSVS